MSGETAEKESGWTVGTLREYLIQRIDGQGLRLDQRMDDAGKAIAAALASAEKAVDRATTANERRFEGVNEFRKALADQTATFLPRPEYDAAHAALIARVDILTERLAALELRLTSRLDTSQGSVAGAAGQRTERRLDTGQMIAVIAVIVSIALGIAVILKK